MMEKPLINKKYRLEKFHGKGGWTYATIPELLQNKKMPFAWIKVKGIIDGFEIRKCHLMPFKGKFFLPVKAEIRKRIKKQEGDYVHITLFADNDPLYVPEEMQLCLQDEPQALIFFNSLSESERKYYIQWVYSAKKEQTKIDRLGKAINKLLKQNKFYENEKAAGR